MKRPNPIDDQSNRKFETLQFRFRSELSSSNQMLIQADNDKMFVVLNDNGSSDNMGSVGLFLEDSAGKNHFVTSSIMPVYDNEFYSVSCDIKRQIKSVFEDHNIEIPYPQKVVHLINEKK